LGRPAEAFHGWLEFTSKLERLRADPAAGAATPTHVRHAKRSLESTTNEETQLT
jgi:hypothetical protein